MKTLRAMLLGVSVLSFVTVNTVFADEHPGKEHPGGDAAVTAPSGGGDAAAAPTEAAPVQKTVKKAKKARKAKKAKKVEETPAEAPAEATPPIGN